MHKILNQRSSLLLGFLFFCGILMDSCVLYSRYKRPCMEMPREWRLSSDELSTVYNARWWVQLGDPVLNQLIEEALFSNQDLRIATARISEYKAQLGIVSSQLYPQIYAQGTRFRERISETIAGQGFSSEFSDVSNTSGQVNPLEGLFPSISPFFNDYRGVFTASYEFDLWGKIRSATEASYADLLGQIQSRRTVILTVVSSIASSYVLLRQYDQQLVVSVQTERSRQESLELANIRFKEGLTSELEVKQASSERDEAALQIIRFKTLIAQQENLMSVLMGHPPQAIQRGREMGSWLLPLNIPAGLPFELLQQRPDILEAEENLKATNFRIGEARALFFPDLTLTGYYGYESAKLHELFINPSKTWQWLLNLLQPIFTGGRLISTLDLAKAQNQEALYNYLQVILTALKEVDNALIAHKNSKELLFVQKAREKDLKEYLRLAKLQYNNGLVDYLNVLDAERRLFGAQLDMAQNEADVFITLVDLYKSLGGGWVLDAENLMKQEWSTNPCDCL